MNKIETIKAIAAAAGVTKAVTEKVLEAQAVVAVSIDTHKEIALPGIGKLVHATKAARTARNPKTGESVNVPARGVVKFKPSTEFKNAVQ